MGNLRYPPNQDAVEYFCEYIWPPLKAKVPDVGFVVIGSGKEALEKRYPDISFTGFHGNPYKLIAECSVFVAPTRFGAGVQTKLLEAMAVGVPVVTTPLGVRGILGAQDGKNIFVIDEKKPDEWVRVLSGLLSDTSVAMRVGDEAKRLIESRHSDIVAQEQFNRVFSEITASNRNGLT
jgi:glycosyltransferase involved in cell wall biosynthesis